MTNYHSVAAAMDGTTAVLNSCRLKHRRGYGEGRSIRQGRGNRTKARTFLSSLSSMVGKLVMKERRVWRILNCMSTPCEMQSFVV